MHDLHYLVASHKYHITNCLYPCIATQRRKFDIDENHLLGSKKTDKWRKVKEKSERNVAYRKQVKEAKREKAEGCSKEERCSDSQEKGGTS